MIVIQAILPSRTLLPGALHCTYRDDAGAMDEHFYGQSGALRRCSQGDSFPDPTAGACNYRRLIPHAIMVKMRPFGSS